MRITFRYRRSYSDNCACDRTRLHARSKVFGGIHGQGGHLEARMVTTSAECRCHKDQQELSGLRNAAHHLNSCNTKGTLVVNPARQSLKRMPATDNNAGNNANMQICVRSASTLPSLLCALRGKCSVCRCCRRIPFRGSVRRPLPHCSCTFLGKAGEVHASGGKGQAE